MGIPSTSLILGVDLPIYVRGSYAGLYLCTGAGRHEEYKLTTFELIVVRNGSLRMYEGKREFTIHRGETLLLWPNRLHGGIGDYEPGTQFYWLHFTLKRNKRMQDLNDKFTLPQTGSPRRPERLFELFHRYLSDFEEDFGESLALDLLACEILLEAGRVRSSAISREDESLAAKAKVVIDAEFQRNLSPGGVASALGYSLEYVGDKFRAAFGLTLGQYIKRRRMEAARYLLRNRALRIKEVAMECGFNSEQYLCRIFRKEAGISPSEYRSLYSRIPINVG